jgi:hypothetical protein
MSSIADTPAAYSSEYDRLFGRIENGDPAKFAP